MQCLYRSILLSLAVIANSAYADGDLKSKFSNIGGISNTRHNLTQRQASGGGPTGVIMDPYRNDYQEVCVYCHTPHGSNTTVALPLWNRTIKATTYTTYNALNTTSLTQVVSQPGAASLSCLSCHDGQTAVDSIINMPGSGRYDKAQETSQNITFLNSWGNNPRGPGPFAHLGLNSTECLACHAAGAGVVGTGAADFGIAAIGTDLKDDHPVGITFPSVNGAGTDFNTPTGTKGASDFFDVNADSFMNKEEVRTYDGKVECASCHDPHGVPSGGATSENLPTFLRKSNAGSALCLTCHSK